jgi:hypothetical protein
MRWRQWSPEGGEVCRVLTMPGEITDHVLDQPDDTAHVPELMTVQYAALAGALEDVPQIGER